MFTRAAGILLHPTSLPGPFGSGDLGPASRQFLDWLASAGQQLWQVLPLGPTGYGYSPYLCYSALAGNPALISPELLAEDGWLQESDWADCPTFPSDRVDFASVLPYRDQLLRRAYSQFLQKAAASDRQLFQAFCEQEADWLDDYALFMAIKQASQGQPWTEWPEALRQRQPQALAKARDRWGGEISFQQFLQWQFREQWLALREEAQARRISLIGDIPIYVAHDSADVWANPQFFALDPETGAVNQQAGVPPDYFSETGQLWGNPVYNWAALQTDGYRWWLQRLQQLLSLVDYIRIDHFRGLEAFWSVPAGEETAIEGEWVKAPGADLLSTIRQQLGALPILAEDLGVITPEVEDLRDRFELPGMKILQFAFDSGSGNAYLPHNYWGRRWVVYTGTHDNDTTVGWFLSRNDSDRQAVLDYLGAESGWEIEWKLLRLAWSSTADWAIAPLQDVFGLDSSARMNRPGQATGNWDWRFSADWLTGDRAQRLRRLSQLYGRCFG
ncbi:4-alpha-glucanotransferase [Synechococcus elongatus]|uniref:4-alpha-glucanotransferase n=1 Tax=Synechococcus elongatus PCC 11801 TaxID=2219813 RepID=A0AAN1UUL2_SYNEL|nr:4-alpha-glucanotransferase [Synechococcus elongatus]AZB72699.1 4-alpha-glucanotransferase [Synechococcus elongatus PCC 11801]